MLWTKVASALQGLKNIFTYRKKWRSVDKLSEDTPCCPVKEEKYLSNINFIVNYFNVAKGFDHVVRHIHLLNKPQITFQNETSNHLPQPPLKLLKLDHYN